MANSCDYGRFCKVVKRWENLADADGAHHDAEVTNERRTASLHPDRHRYRTAGRRVVMRSRPGWLMKIFDQFVEAEFQADVKARDEQYGPNAPPRCCRALMRSVVSMRW